MPIIEPVHIQQVLQMSSAVEKVQAQLVQHLATGQLRDEDRAVLDGLKRTEVQDPEESNPSDPTNPDSQARRRRLRIKKTAQPTDENEDRVESNLSLREGSQGSNLDIVI